MKLSPVEVYGTVIPENTPREIFYYYAKVLGKSETHSKNATFLQVLQWSYDAPVIPDKHNDWSQQDFELFARFVNPEVMTWTVAQLITVWKFIKDVNENKISFNHIFDIDDHLNIDGNIMAAKLLAELISMGEYTTTSLIRH